MLHVTQRRAKEPAQLHRQLSILNGLILPRHYGICVFPLNCLQLRATNGPSGFIYEMEKRPYEISFLRILIVSTKRKKKKISGPESRLSSPNLREGEQKRREEEGRVACKWEENMSLDFSSIFFF